MSTSSGIHGQLLEVTVIGCNSLKDTEWISRQDPYVCLDYANSKFRTKTCTDGHKNPIFQEKFVISLIEGLRELNVTVWNSNTISRDDFIGSTRVQLQKVLSQGYDDAPWTLQSKSGRYAGEVRLILHYGNASASKIGGKPNPGHVPSTAPSYGAAAAYHAPPPYAVPPPNAAHYQSTASYPPSSVPTYPMAAAPSMYPPSPYPPPSHTADYTHQPYPAATYPQAYPHPHVSPYHPPGNHGGIYPPPY